MVDWKWMLVGVVTGWVANRLYLRRKRRTRLSDSVRDIVKK